MMGAKHTNQPGGDNGETHPSFAFFNIAESNEKLKVTFGDILLVTTDEVRSRNKMAWLKSETKEYTLMNVSFAQLLRYCPTLVKVNKFTLLSFDAIHTYRYDFITLYNLFPDWRNKQVILARNYREVFQQRMKLAITVPNLSFTT
jgi:hypothetical protein